MYEYRAKTIRVIDGDSVWFEVDLGFRMTFRDNFRFLRINAPELRSSDPIEKQKAYAAKGRLEELLPPGREVVIRTEKAGKYGRWLAEVYLVDSGQEESALPVWERSTNVNDLLLHEGHAAPYE